MAVGEIAVEVREEGVGGDEAEEGVDVEMAVDVRGECFVVGVRHQFRELDQPPLLPGGRRLLRPIALGVGLPLRAEEDRSPGEPLRLEQHAG